MSSLTVQDYHIGWICALQDEMVAAMAMLDEEHPMIAGQDRQDHNSYVLGRIHQHNVVIACMPAGVDGVVSAATVAKDMARTFPELRVGLMVGIGSGIPNLARGVDIRLGDVVVSMPDKTWGGVVQFDHGKAESGGVFMLKGQLNQPPEFLLRTLSQVQAWHRMQPSKIIQYINEAVARNLTLEGNGFIRPDAPDQLICTICNGNIDDAASGCNGRHQRKGRKSLAPVLHYGIIASGNVVVKDAVVRDRLRDEFNALCVEMEAAGLMNDFPCLVIRGICDYADFSKNDVWHPYAAMTAAGYTKEFLFYVSPAQASQERPIRESVRVIVDFLRDLRQDSQAQTHALHAQTSYWQDDKHQRCHQAFKPIGSYEEQKDRNPDRVEGTCQWVLMHEQYRQWHDSGGSGLLWISADPGCGKSVLARSLVDHELRSSSTHSICYFFFKDNEEQDSLATALCALLHQLLAQQPQLIRHALAIYDPNKPEKVQQDVAQLWRTLLATASDSNAQDVTCVLDALDECRPSDQSKLIDMLARFHQEAQRQLSTAHVARLKFVVTSRPYDDIKHDFHRTLHDLPSIQLQAEDRSDQITHEINLVIRKRVTRLAEDLGLRSEVAEQLQSKLLQIEHRTYLWLHLAIESIYTTYRSSFAPEEESVVLLPKTVEDAYEKILSRIQDNQRSKVKKILQIIVGSRRPLTVAEMAIALGIAHRRSPGVRSVSQARLDPVWVGGNLRHWCGLFVFFNHKRIYLIHQTAKEFLLADTRVCDPPSGWRWRHCLTQCDTEVEMAQICTDLLNFQDVRTTAQDLIKRSGPFYPAESNLEQDDAIETLVAYAAEHWPSHFRVAQNVVNEEYLDELTPFYEPASGLQHLWFPICWRATQKYENLPHVNALQLAGLLGHAQQVAHMLQSARLYGIDDSDQDGNTALVWASRYGHGTVVQMLLEAGADVNAQGGRYGSALQTASQGGYKEVVQIVLEVGADVNAQGGRYGSALQTASQGGYKEVVQILLEAGADVNAQRGYYGSALQTASRGGYKEVVQMLLEAGADVNAQGDYYGSALQMASRGGYKEVVQILLEAGADVNAQRGHYGSALQTASRGGYKEVVQMLLEAGADVNAQRGEQSNALYVASQHGYTDVMQMLLEAGADVNARGGKKSNALCVASYCGHKKAVQMLLEAGADVNAQGCHHGNALYTASLRGHEKVVQMLLEAGADVNTQGSKQSNALYVASQCGHTEVVQMLLEAGADVNTQGSKQSNALYVASQCGHTEVVQMLLEVGADVNAQGSKQSNALYVASQCGHTEVVQMLLEAGADVNAQGSKQSNALYVASQCGHTEVVQMLLEAGADVNTQGGHYGSALQTASQCGHTEVVQMLLEAGADVNARGGHYGSALQTASQGGHTNVMQMLLEAGADVNAHGGRYGSALQTASQGGYKEVVQMLLEAGADVNAPGGYYSRAMHAAAECGHLEVVQILLNTGADADARTTSGESILRAAASGSSPEVINLLLASGAKDFEIVTFSLARIFGKKCKVYLRRNQYSEWEVRT